MEPDRVLSLLLGGFGVNGILAAAATIARSSSVKQTLELLRGERDDYIKANARLETENTALRTSVAKQEQEITVLRDLATGRGDLAQLADELRGYSQMIHRDYQTLVGLFYRNPDDAQPAQEARREPHGGRRDG